MATKALWQQRPLPGPFEPCPDHLVQPLKLALPYAVVAPPIEPPSALLLLALLRDSALATVAVATLGRRGASPRTEAQEQLPEKKPPPLREDVVESDRK